jgi:hypothetical protein
VIREQARPFECRFVTGRSPLFPSLTRPRTIAFISASLSPDQPALDSSSLRAWREETTRETGRLVSAKNTWNGLQFRLHFVSSFSSLFLPLSLSSLEFGHSSTSDRSTDHSGTFYSPKPPPRSTTTPHLPPQHHPSPFLHLPPFSLSLSIIHPPPLRVITTTQLLLLDLHPPHIHTSDLFRPSWDKPHLQNLAPCTRYQISPARLAMAGKG